MKLHPNSDGTDVSSTARTGQRAAELVGWFDPTVSYVIALSGGVDSAVVAAAAHRSEAVCEAVTAISASVAEVERLDAARAAELIGISHRCIATSELESSDYRQNDPQRCFHCKSHLFAALATACPEQQILTGTNQDDLGDYRPGLRAAEKSGVLAPLAELSIGKAEVRAIAALWGLPIAEKPASPCLASRIAYGVAVTEERLQRVEEAEKFLRELGLSEFRVRLHEGEMARIEVQPEAIEMLASPNIRDRLLQEFKRRGFKFVTLDLAGFSSGSLNQLVQIGTKR